MPRNKTAGAQGSGGWITETDCEVGAGTRAGRGGYFFSGLVSSTIT